MRLGMTFVLIFVGIFSSASSNDGVAGSALFLIAFASIVFNSVWLFRYKQQR